MTELINLAHLTAEQVADKVRPYLEGRVVNGKIRLSVDNEDIWYSHDSGYWRVPIRPSIWPRPTFPYYEELADIEDAIQENEGLKISLASGEPVEDKEQS